ncbi:MAG TPA: hypothetical protein DDZ64_04475, partial [Acidimicrobiaceae bacterium]|nr:hypothetical protein [Acidimicrobiaceae bacterium]
MSTIATQWSSRQTILPGISPSMIRVKIEATGSSLASVGGSPDRRLSAVEQGMGEWERRVRTGWSGVLTVPNLISLGRLACIPWFVWILFEAGNRTDAALLLGALGATDWIDGWVARRFDQVSDVGRVLDPTADRLLLLVALVAMLIDGSVPPWFAVLV